MLRICGGEPQESMRELSKSKGFVVVQRETGGDTATEIMEESEKGSQKDPEEAENAESDDSEKAKDSGKVAAYGCVAPQELHTVD